MNDFEKLCKDVDEKFADKIKSGKFESLGVNTSDGLKEQFDAVVGKCGVVNICYMDYKVNDEDTSKYTLQILTQRFDSDGMIIEKGE